MCSVPVALGDSTSLPLSSDTNWLMTRVCAFESDLSFSCRIEMWKFFVRLLDSVSPRRGVSRTRSSP